MSLKDAYREPPQLSVWIGFDPRWVDAFAVARATVERAWPQIRCYGLVLSALREAGLYWRETEERFEDLHDAVGKVVARRKVLYDVISEHAMSTEFAISRFLVPHLARLGGPPSTRPKRGWALFLDCDMLMLPGADLGALFRECETKHADKAVVCVKHDHQPAAALKMDGQPQSRYGMKNWSSFMLFNLAHPANRALTVELVNSVPGRDLHAFCWLPENERDELIGEIGQEWNWLNGHSSDAIDPMNVHFTDGIPSLYGFADARFADDWRAELTRWAANGARYLDFPRSSPEA